MAKISGSDIRPGMVIELDGSLWAAVKTGAVKPGKIAKFVAKDAAGFDLPLPGGLDDPTLGGAQLLFFDTYIFGGGTAS